MCKITSKQERLINIMFIDLRDEISGMSNISAVIEENLSEWGRVELADFLSLNVKGFSYSLNGDKWKIVYSGKSYKRRDIKGLFFEILKKAALDKNLSSSLLEQINPSYVALIN